MKASPRICILKRSVIAKFLVIPKSKFVYPKPRIFDTLAPSPKLKLNELAGVKEFTFNKGSFGLKLPRDWANGFAPGKTLGMQAAANCEGTLQ